MMGAVTFVLAHPLRLRGPQLDHVDDAGPAGAAQDIAVIVSTVKGERALLPDFGVPDRTLLDLTVADVNACLTRYGRPDVTAADLTRQLLSDAAQTVTLTFTSN